MSDNGFHFSRNIEENLRTAHCLYILKEADGPLTQGDIYDLSKSLNLYRQTNAATTINEISRHAGYVFSNGQDFGQKRGPAVRFPDGKYRYWLIAAPGWTPRWRFVPKFDETGKRMVSYDLVHYRPDGTVTLDSEQPSPKPDDSPAICKNPPCGTPIPPERAREGRWTCCDVCDEQWRRGLRPKNSDAEATLPL